MSHSCRTVSLGTCSMIILECDNQLHAAYDNCLNLMSLGDSCDKELELLVAHEKPVAIQ